MLSAYRPLFSYQGYSGEGVRKYRALLDNDETHITYEEFPCLALMIPGEIKKQLIADPQIATYATAFFDMPKVKENQYNNIFEANRPLLKDADDIFPGQDLRIPA